MCQITVKQRLETFSKTEEKIVRFKKIIIEADFSLILSNSKFTKEKQKEKKILCPKAIQFNNLDSKRRHLFVTLIELQIFTCYTNFNEEKRK